ncbi:TPA: F-type conjugal transfer pilus assembly protein TraB [Aeromonas veronii]
MNINALTKQKQIWLFIGTVVVLGTALFGGWYISTADKRHAEAAAAANEPAPDLTGVVDNQFGDKVQQSVITEIQLLNKDMKAELDSVRQEMAMLSRERSSDQQRLNALETENKALKESIGKPTGTPQPLVGEPMPNVLGAPTTGVSTDQIPPPTAFYSGVGTVPAGQITMQPIAPAPKDLIDSTSFGYDDEKTNKKPMYPYIPSGSFAKAIVIEGADTNASVTGSENTAPMQLRLTGQVQMPNDHEYDLTGCFVTLEAWGDVSSERAIVRSRGISCKKGEDVIDQQMSGHVSFMGKNGIKGEVIMRNGEILGWAWGAGFVDGIGAGMEKAGTPQVGIGATASAGAGDIFKAGVGGGMGQAGKSLSDYYIKRAEQYHPIIPIGAGNEVTLVFQDGFQLETIEEARLRKTANKPATPEGSDVSVPNAVSSLKNLKVGDLVDPPLQ